MGKDLIYTRILLRCVLVGVTLPSDWLNQTRVVVDLMGKDFIYTRVLSRVVWRIPVMC